MEETSKKKWYQSKTIWISILTIISGIITAIIDQLSTGGAITLIGIVNMVLRIVTKSELI